MENEEKFLEHACYFFHIVTSSAVSIISIAEADPREQSEWLEKSIEVAMTFMHITMQV